MIDSYLGLNFGDNYFTAGGKNTNADSNSLYFQHTFNNMLNDIMTGDDDNNKSDNNSLFPDLSANYQSEMQQKEDASFDISSGLSVPNNFNSLNKVLDYNTLLNKEVDYVDGNETKSGKIEKVVFKDSLSYLIINGNEVLPGQLNSLAI
jgi:hypothetical protein